MRTNRIGKIKLTRELIMSSDHEANRRLLFQAFHPYHIETAPYPKYMVYYGICEAFRELPEGEMIPEYTAEYEDDGKGNISLFFKAV